MTRTQSVAFRSCTSVALMILLPLYCFAQAAVPGSAYEYYMLSVKGSDVNFPKAVTGGAIFAGVQRPTASHRGKNIEGGGYEVEDTIISIGFDESPDLYDWIKAASENGGSPRSCFLTVYDQNRQPKEKTELRNTIISEISVPACDTYASQEPAYLSVSLSPQKAVNVPNPAPWPSGANTPTQRMWIPSNFKLEIAGLDCTKVTRIESFSIKQLRNALGNPALEVSNLRVTVPESAGQTWKAWCNDFLVLGHNAESNEKSGTLTLLAGNGADACFQVKFINLGLSRFGKDPANAANYVADLFCDSMRFQYIASQGGAPASGSTASSQAPGPALEAAMPDYIATNVTERELDSDDFEIKGADTITVEGRSTYTQYKPKSKTASPLQIGRYYENAVTRMGGVILYEYLSSLGGVVTMKMTRGSDEIWIRVYIGDSGNVYYLSVITRPLLTKPSVKK